MGFTSCAQSAGMKKSLHLRIYSYLKDEGLSFRVTTLFAVKYDLSVLSLWADAYNNKLLNNGRIPVKLTVLTEFSPQLTEDGHHICLLSRTARQLSGKKYIVIVFCSMHLLYDSSLTKNIALDSTIVNTPFNYFLFFLARTTLWITRNRQSIAAIVMPVHHA